MADGKIEDIEKALEFLGSNYRIKPTHAQMPLRQFRELCAKHGALDHAVKFLKETAEVPDNAIVVMRPGHLSLLTDKEGCLLEFA